MGGFKKNNNFEHVLQQWYNLYKKNKNNNINLYKNINWEKIKNLGIPQNNDEKWKNFPLKRFLSYTFVPPNFSHILNACKFNDLILEIDAYRVVFINGYFSSYLSDTNTGLWQIKLNYQSQLLPKAIQSDFFLYLTELLSNEIFYISLSSGKKADKPLYLLHINSGSEHINKLNTSHYRYHIEIFPYAHGQIIEHFVSTNQKYGYFSGTRASITIKNNANFNHIKLIFENKYSYHIAHNDIHAEENAQIVDNTFIILNSGVTHHQTNAKLNKEKTSLSINSLTIPINYGIVDIITYLEHNAKNCLSKQLHKSIICDYGKNLFNNLIKVNKQAIKTDGHIINKNLLLSKYAQINSQPQLEIYTDDVKCTHGVTVGNVDDNQLYYLCSRGISYRNALQMIIYAFSYEVTKLTNNNDIINIIMKNIMNTLYKIII